MLRSIRTGIPAAALFAAFVLAGGCASDRITQPDPNAPTVPTAENPPDGALDHPAAVTFTWSSTDPSGDSLTYDFYISEGHRPQLLVSGLTTPDYHISTLRPLTEYHWKIVARSPTGMSTHSPTWKFETWEHPVVPVVEGARWRYDVEVAEFNVRNATGPHTIPDTTRRVRVEIVGAQFRDAGGDWVHEGTIVDSIYQPIVYATQSYFITTNTESAYYQIQQRTPAAASASEAHYSFRGNAYHSLLDLRRSLVRQAGRRSSARPAGDLGSYAHDLLYPLEVGREWTYGGEPGERTYKKKVVGREVREVQGRPTACYIVEWLFDYDGDGVWEDDIEMVDYYSELGRVYSRSVVRDVDVTSYVDPYGESGGIYDISFEDVATDVYIPEFP